MGIRNTIPYSNRYQDEGFGMRLGDRLLNAMKERGWSEGELARRAGLKQPTVHRIISGQSKDPRYANVQSLAKALGVSPEWLRDGKGDASTSKLPEVEGAPEAKGLAPMISWVQAGNWADVGAVAMDPSETEYFPIPPNCGPRTYVLRVRGESMIDEYQPGVLIYVDPDAELISGDDVIVQCESHGGAEATFKRYVEEPGVGPMLKAMNSAWKERYMSLTSECRVVGVVMAQIKMRRH